MITCPAVAHEDGRGQITDLLDDASIQHVAMFTTNEGSVRGGHYHRESTAWLYVMLGRALLRWRDESSTVEEAEVLAGDLVRIDPLERHDLRATEPCCWLMMTSGPDGGRQYEGDTVEEAV